jgi:hypothetical protein
MSRNRAWVKRIRGIFPNVRWLRAICINRERRIKYTVKWKKMAKNDFSPCFYLYNCHYKSRDKYQRKSHWENGNYRTISICTVCISTAL